MSFKLHVESKSQTNNSKEGALGHIFEGGILSDIFVITIFKFLWWHLPTSESTENILHGLVF